MSLRSALTSTSLADKLTVEGIKPFLFVCKLIVVS